MIIEDINEKNYKFSIKTMQMVRWILLGRTFESYINAANYANCK